jgi:hypothetical protein
MRDNKSNSQLVFLGTLALSGTTPAASSLVDLRGYDAATIVVKTNTVTDAGTAAGFTVTAQASDLTTNASFADIVAADTTDGTIAVVVTSDSDDDKIMGAVGYVGNKRYVRVRAVGTAGTDAGVDVYALLTEPARAKTTFIGTAVSST